MEQWWRWDFPDKGSIGVECLFATYFCSRKTSNLSDGVLTFLDGGALAP